MTKFVCGPAVRCAAVWCALAGFTGLVSAAQTAPLTAPAPVPSPTAQPRIPLAPPARDPQTPTAPPAPIKFPPIDSSKITATSPTPQTVDAFLHAVWGSDDNREWRVASIQPASEPGFVKVEVLVGDKRQPTRIATYAFLVTPDGKHAVVGDLAPFGPTPFAENRAILQQRANGPARGAADKQLEFVEFSDLQCPNCKAAHGTVDQLVKDFPQAHIVFENLPLPAVHAYALQAAELGVCVRQAKGDPAFFTYAQKVFDSQADLTPDKADATLRVAIIAAGADPTAVMACSTQPATHAAVDAQIKLATDLGITSTPTLAVNGRILPLTQVPYAGLKKVIIYQGQLDGIAVKEQPSLTTLK